MSVPLRLHGTQSNGILAVVLPVIREVILEDSPRLGHPLNRGYIARRIADHPKSASHLRARYHGQKGSFDEWCRNLVDWYGAKWTSSEDAFGHPTVSHDSALRMGRNRVDVYRGVRRLDVAGETHWLYEADPAGH